MRERSSGLQRTLALFTAGLVVVSLAVCGALVVITTWQHRASVTLADAMDLVRLAQQAQIDLLVHERTEEAARRTQLEDELLQRLDEMKPRVSGERAARLAGAEGALGQYVASARGGDVSADLREPAHAALDALIRSSVAHSRETRERAAEWDRLADVLGFATGGALVVIAGLLLMWMRGALKPVVALSEVIRQFAHGDREARAEERGPAELRAIAVRFNEMTDALASQRREQIAFVGGVAHDLRSPLSALSMSVGMLAPDGALPSEASIRRLASTMRRQVTRLERMIQDLLQVTRIEAGHVELKTGTEDVGALVREVVGLFEVTFAERRIRATISHGFVFANCDAMRIEQVVSNLVSNAIKYSPGGRDIEVVVSRRAHEAVIAVTDYGIGISAEDQTRLFEPFRRVGLSKETIPGVGLGLFVVRRIVEAHGGRIEVESSLGRGSTFRAFLPLVEASALGHHAAGEGGGTVSAS